jgi:hypothetical protein
VSNPIVWQRIFITHAMLLQIILHLLQMLQLLLVAARLVSMDTVTVVSIVW